MSIERIDLEQTLYDYLPLLYRLYILKGGVMVGMEPWRSINI